MLTTKFIIVSGIDILTDIEYTVLFDFYPINPTIITFSGNRIVEMKNPINEKTKQDEEMYGRVVLAYEMEEVHHLYIILKNRTIFPIDHWSLHEIDKACRAYEVIKDFESLKIIRAFVNL